MQTQSAKEVKYNFRGLIDLAQAEPMMVETHGRPVIVVLAIERYQRSIAIATAPASAGAAAANVSGESHD